MIPQDLGNIHTTRNSCRETTTQHLRNPNIFTCEDPPGCYYQVQSPSYGTLQPEQLSLTDARRH